MAKSKNNIVTHGLSGKVGDLLVFRQVGGKTIVSKVPKKSDKVSEKQKEQRQKFQEAVIYSKSVEQDDNIKELYELKARQKGLKTTNVAIADFLNAPKIEEVHLDNYSGKVGDTIKIKVFDDFKVKAVTVIIQNPDGSLVEQGDATENGLYWVYVATANNADLNGDKITIRAFDIPDNIAEKETVL